MFCFFFVLKLSGFFRVNAADEAAGLDASHHGGSAYPVDLDDDSSHKGSNYNGTQYNKVGLTVMLVVYVCDVVQCRSPFSVCCSSKSKPDYIAALLGCCAFTTAIRVASCKCLVTPICLNESCQDNDSRLDKSANVQHTAIFYLQ